MKTNSLRRVLVCAATILMAMAAKAQTVDVYIFDNDGPFTNVRNSPGSKGKVVGKIPVDTSAMLTVMSPQNGWWCIVGDSYEDLDDTGDWKEVKLKGSTTGYWVHNSVIAFSTRNYGDQKLPLRAEPRTKAAVNYTLKGEQQVRPIDVRGEWVKVKTLDGKGQGWIESEWICGNSVTTCP